jgi:hypothetical protein
MFTFVLSCFAQAAEEGKMYAELKGSEGQVVKDSSAAPSQNFIPGYGYDSAYDPGYNPY